MEISNNYINEIKTILKNARQKVYNSIISAMIEHIGKLAEGLQKKSRVGKKKLNMGKKYYKIFLRNLQKSLEKDIVIEHQRN